MRLLNLWVFAVAVPVVALASMHKAHADLIGTQVSFGTLYQQTSTSAPLPFSTTASVTVSSAVEFPSLAAYAIANSLGLGIVNGAVDVTANGLTETFLNAGSGMFATAFKNDAVFTFDSSALVNTTGAVVDPSSNLGLTNADLTLSGDQLFINYGGGQSFNPNSRLQIDLVGVPEPGTLLLFGTGLCGLLLALSAGNPKRIASGKIA